MIIERIIHGVNEVARWIAGLILIAVTFGVFANIIARDLAGTSYLGTQILAQWATAWMTFLAAAYIVPTHGHVAIDLLLRNTKTSLKRVVIIVTSLAGMATSAICVIYGAELSAFIFSTGQIEITTDLSPGILYLSIVVGMALMFVNYADLFIAMLRKDDTRLP